MQPWFESRDGGSSLAWISTRDARAAEAAGTQRRPISRLVRASPPFSAAPRTTAAGNVSLGSSTHGAFAAGATRTQRRPIYSFGAVLAADHLLLGISTHDARAAAAAGTQRRPISRLGSRLTTPARRGRPERSGGPSLAWRPNSQRLRVRAVAAGVQRRPMSRLVARLAAPSRRARPGRSREVNSQRPRGGGGRDIAAAHLSLRNPTRGAFTTGPGRQEDSN
eukprot:tig00020553_g10734.t1